MIDVPTVLSGLSFLFTLYFWMVKANKETPKLDFYHLSDFFANLRHNRDDETQQRLCITPRGTGNVLIMNQSTRQNSVVSFDCYLITDHGEIQGDWGYGGEDRPPWNIGPESTIAFSPACFFDVEKDYEMPENPKFRIECITASGKRFSHILTKMAPRLRASDHSAQKKAA